MLRPRGNPAAFASPVKAKRTELVRPAGHVVHILVGRANGSIPERRPDPAANADQLRRLEQEVDATCSDRSGRPPTTCGFACLAFPVTCHAWFWLAGLITGWHRDERRPDQFAVHLDRLFVCVDPRARDGSRTRRRWPSAGHPRLSLWLRRTGRLSPTSGHTTGRSVLISFAGPGAGFVFYGLILCGGLPSDRVRVAADARPRWQLRLLEFFDDMEFINLYWGLVNLLPVLPLDGGRIARRFSVAFDRGTACDLAAMLSVIVGRVAFYFFLHREEYGTYPAILFWPLGFLERPVAADARTLVGGEQASEAQADLVAGARGRPGRR